MQKQSANVIKMKNTVEQLKRENAVVRQKVSVTFQELINYCEANKKDDVLVQGFKSQADNPYRNESMCTSFASLCGKNTASN